MQFNQLASKESVAKTKTSLEKNGFTVFVTPSGPEARTKALELIPPKAEVMNMTSVTLETLGLDKAINDSDQYNSVRKKLMSLNRATHSRLMQQIGSTPEYSLGSVQAVTEQGQLVCASNTGSQLPAYAYGANHAIWVVGTQKIVPDLDTAFKRIYEYVLPLESERANKAYNITTGSYPSKILIINQEIKPNRATVILVNEILGF